MGAADHIRSAVASNETVSASKTQKHKVVLESVTQEKKKLRQVVSTIVVVIRILFSLLQDYF